MAVYHFVEEYERHVDKALEELPLDEAMSRAIGGSYELIGPICAEIAIHAGVRDGASVFDFGCGSGRVSTALAKRVSLKRYLGTDVVQKLLDYAASRSPDHYQYIRHPELSVPAEDNAFDVAYAFSVFTHLYQAESFIYLQDIHRVLKPGGMLAMSFLEFAEPRHWHVFTDTVEKQRGSKQHPLNAFVERNQIEAWADHIGFSVMEFVGATERRWNGRMLGQSIAFLRKA